MKKRTPKEIPEVIPSRRCPRCGARPGSQTAYLCGADERGRGCSDSTRLVVELLGVQVVKRGARKNFLAGLKRDYPVQAARIGRNPQGRLKHGE